MPDDRRHAVDTREYRDKGIERGIGREREKDRQRERQTERGK